MNALIPTLFISHGAPSLLIENTPTRSFLTGLGQTISRPRAIMCVSAHWTTSALRLTAVSRPETIHDFGGFPDELYRITYPAPGAPQLAEKTIRILAEQGITAEADPHRGLDHGAWVPLSLMYPDADIPVIQLSVQPYDSPARHAALGAALKPLREDGILIIASGSATHNLNDLFGRAINSATPDYVREFDDWLRNAILANDRNALFDYVHQGPHALQNHPTPEHLLPLFVAMGAGGEAALLHESYNHGVISMAAYSWS